MKILAKRLVYFLINNKKNMYKATIRQVEKRNDEIEISMEFSNGEELKTIKYQFKSKIDINTRFDETMKNELDRLNGLEEAYITLKARENEEIKSEIIKK